MSINAPTANANPRPTHKYVPQIFACDGTLPVVRKILHAVPRYGEEHEKIPYFLLESRGPSEGGRIFNQ